MEVEPLDEIQLEDLGLNTCNNDIPLSSRKVPSFDEPKPQPQPLPNCPPLDISLGDEIGPEPTIKPHSPDSFRMKEVDNLTIHTPPLPHMASFHSKDMYCYYHPCIDDPKKHYGFKLGRKAHLLEDKQIPSVGVFDEVTWMAFGGNTLDLGLFGEEMDEITTLHQSRRRKSVQTLETASQILAMASKVLKDGVRIIVTASKHNRIKEALEVLVDRRC
ncbi:hypothetical protein Tco_0336730 [Tanacetum coccineum]